MRFIFRLLLPCILMSGLPVSLIAQDTRTVSEPTFPPSCAVYRAPLQTISGGPGVGPSVTEQDIESTAETALLNTMLQKCDAGQAVELALGLDSSQSAFLINPITLPSGVSLIIDGGVTVYGSRDPANYLDSSPDTNPLQIQCGTYGQFPPLMGCISLFSVSDGSGIYGDGIIDGQGNQMLLGGPYANLLTWWDLTAQKVGQIGHSSGINQSSPQIIAPAPISGEKNSSANDVTLYKITIRNPPFHTVSWGGNGLTVWGVKIQAPWNVTNSDGFDLHGTNGTLYDTTVSNGDDDIAFAVSNGPTSNFTIDHFHIYGRDGITILGNSDKYPTSNLLIQNVTETGDLPSVVGTTVNGVSEKAMMSTPYSLVSYAQALPNATGDIHGVNIKPTPSTNAANPSNAGATITNVTFKSICMQDIEDPINIVPQATPDPNSPPTVNNIIYQDIHVLAPTPQFPLLKQGRLTDPAAPGMYSLFFEAAPPTYFNNFTLNNVVIDDLASGATSLANMTAKTVNGNSVTTLTNVYPQTLNTMNMIQDSNNTYVSPQTKTSSAGLAYGCPSSFPYTVGDLYLSSGITATGSATNLQTMTITQGGSVTLNAVVQPIMSQATLFVPKIFSSSPGLLAVGSPALSNPVNFYEGSTLIGAATLSANGTLASLVVKNISAGTHTYTAQYPPDSYYAALNLDPVTVVAVPPAATTTILSSSSASVNAGASITVTATVTTGSTGTPTGAVTFSDGSAVLSTVNLDPTGQAAYTTSALTIGNHSITASYGGDSNFSGSTSSAVSVTVLSAPVPDFSFSLSSSRVTVTKSTPATITLNVASVNGFDSSVAFACSGLPAGVTCNFNPPTITPSGSAPVSTSITFGASSLAMIQGTPTVVIAFGCVGWLFCRTRRRSMVLCLGTALFAAMLGAISGCGTDDQESMPVSSTITITAVSQNISHSTTITLTYSN